MRRKRPAPRMIIALPRNLVAVLCACTAQATFAAESPATAYPVRPIRLIVPTAPGGGTDNVARTYAPQLSQLLGQQVVVDNRAGAGGSIGATLASRAPCDGYTLLATFATHATNPAVLKDTQYDLIRDFQPITLTVVLPNLLVVNPALGVKDVKSLIALARSQPGKVQFASGSFGASSHLSMELLLGMTGTRMLNVPYKGVGPALTAVVAGEVQVMIGSLLSALPQVRNARLTALGVTSAKRASAAPDIPTIAEAGVPGYQADNWSGLLAPAGTARGVVMKLYAAVVKVLQDPAVNQRFVTEGGEPAPSRSPEAFGEMIRTEVQKWSKVAREAGIQPQ
ncbi:MAG: tripartite tricarboxylate transporter substrate binding protein [Burkholderiales bacterium]